MKFRASCDNCSASKVGCTQEHPVCSRCAVQGSLSKYSQSMRRGKPKGLRRPQTTAVSGGVGNVNSNAVDSLWPRFDPLRSSAISYVEQLKNLVGSAGDLSHPRLAQSASDWSTAELSVPEPSAPSTAAVSQQEFVTVPPSDLIIPSYGFSSSSPQKSVPVLANAVMDGAFPPTTSPILPGVLVNTLPLVPRDSTLSEYSTDPESHFNHMLLKSTDVTSTEEMSMEASSSSSQKEHDCIGLSLYAIKDLFKASNHTSNSILTVEEVLEITQPVMHTIGMLLACTQYHDPHFPLLLASSISKILAWYQAVNLAVSPLSTDHVSDQSLQVVNHTPFMLGTYQLESEDEEHLKTQLVLQKLKRVNRLVEGFAQRFCETRNGSQGEENPESICSALGIFLRYRYAETVGGIPLP